MVTSPYEWKILEWDEKPQTNKQTKSNHPYITIFLQARITSLKQIMAPLQIYHFVTIHILAEPLKASLNEKADYIFVNKLGSLET